MFVEALWVAPPKTFTPCAKCGGERLVYLRQDLEDGWGSWCTNCKMIWAAPTKIRKPEQIPAGITYEGRLYPDGTVSWKAEAAGVRAFVDPLSLAFRTLSTAALRREEHLRGADRWIFGKDGGAYHALYQDTDRVLEPFTKGEPRRLRPRSIRCEVCRREIEVGKKAYRVAKPAVGFRQGWGIVPASAVFCAPCVETPSVAGIAGVIALPADQGGTRP